MEVDIITYVLKIFHVLGLDNPAEASGWIVALFIGAGAYWRLSVMDKAYNDFVEKISDLMEKQENEWRELISKTDEMTFEILKTSTSTMTVLSEKINTLQMLLIHNPPKI